MNLYPYTSFGHCFNVSPLILSFILALVRGLLEPAKLEKLPQRTGVLTRRDMLYLLSWLWVRTRKHLPPFSREF